MLPKNNRPAQGFAYRFTHLVFQCFALALMGCGQQQAAQNSDPLQQEIDRTRTETPPTGDLSTLVRMLQESPLLENCESGSSFKSKQLELAKALDTHADAIRTFRSQWSAQVSNLKLVSLGPIEVIESGRLKPESGEEGQYTVSRQGWNEFFQVYESIKDQPANLEWVRLERSVLGNLTDDVNRLLKNQDYWNTRLGPAFVPHLAQVIQECQKDSKCVSPKFDEQDLNYLQNIARYHAIHQQILNSQNDTDRRKWIGVFAKRLGSDAFRYQFYRYPLIRRKSRSEIVLPLYSKDFESLEDQKQISSWVEQVWKSSQLKVILEWVTDSSLLKSLFQIRAIAKIPGRSGVAQSKRLMKLYDFTSSRAIAHEFGHVLGFDDHYYTYFNDQTCSYRDDLDGSDLMSNHETGSVLDSDWEVLNREYPFK